MQGLLSCQGEDIAMDKVTEIKLDSLTKGQEEIKTQLDKLDDRLRPFEIQIARIDGAVTRPHPWWVPVVGGAVILTALGWIPWTISFGQRLTKVESTVEQMPAQIARDLLSQAKVAIEKGDTKAANRAISAASSLLAVARERKVRVDPSFFRETIDDLSALATAKDPTLQTVANEQKIQLAEYRSLLNPPPPLPKKKADQLPANSQFIAAVYPNKTTMKLSPPKPVTFKGYGAAIDNRAMQPGQEIFVVETRSLEDNPVVIEGLTLIGATQSLDYVTWKDVTFFNVHIKYHGGPVRLSNVRFVNCTFDLPSNDAGARVAEYAALEPKEEVKVG